MAMPFAGAHAEFRQTFLPRFLNAALDTHNLPNS
jgi:hypothetical protein